MRCLCLLCLPWLLPWSVLADVPAGYPMDVYVNWVDSSVHVQHLYWFDELAGRVPGVTGGGYLEPGLYYVPDPRGTMGAAVLSSVGGSGLLDLNFPGDGSVVASGSESEGISSYSASAMAPEGGVSAVVAGGFLDLVVQSSAGAVASFVGVVIVLIFGLLAVRQVVRLCSRGAMEFGLQGGSSVRRRKRESRRVERSVKGSRRPAVSL